MANVKSALVSGGGPVMKKRDEAGSAGMGCMRTCVGCTPAGTPPSNSNTPRSVPGRCSVSTMPARSAPATVTVVMATSVSPSREPPRGCVRMT